MPEKNVIYREFEPVVRLHYYIKAYCFFRISTDTEMFFYILPDGYFDMLVVIKNDRIADTRITGIWSKSITVRYSEDTEVLGIRFKPLAIGALLRFTVNESLDDSQRIDLKDFGMEKSVLLETLRSFPEAILSYLNENFTRLLLYDKSDSRLKKCFALIDASDGTITVDELSKAIGLSARQLHRLVNKMIGIGIKDYAKIVRFKKSLREVKKDKAGYFHYYDQSHYIREVKQYTGYTPDQLDLNKDDRFLQYYDFEEK